MAAARPPREQLLRYSFDTTTQLRRHLHLAGGRVLFFYPSLLSLRVGEPIYLDVSLAEPAQHHSPLRGKPLSRHSDNDYTGSWLEFPAYSVVESLYGGMSSPRRRARRFPCHVVAYVGRAEPVHSVAVLTEIAEGGARAAGLTAPMILGEEAKVSLAPGGFDCPPLSATIVWKKENEVGLQFRELDERQREATRAIIEGAKEKLAVAEEVVHAQVCHCAEGQPVAEPPLPALVR